MSDRWEKRKSSSEVKRIVSKAKQDMADWLSSQDDLPTERDMKVWQEGYLYGLNRGTGNKDK